MRKSTRARRTVAATAVASVAALGVAAAVPSVAGAANTDRTAAAKAAITGGTARNVILLLGDGMGDSEITIARDYGKGAAGRLAMDGLPLTGEYTTYSVDKADPTKPNYVTDSAASGTGWATGHKTYNGAISVTPDGKPKQTILEAAKAAGYKTGDVSTAEIEDATPAVLVSHVTDRSCYGPDDVATTCPTNALENGGAGSIAEQLLTTMPDVTLGGGSEAFGQTVHAGEYAGRTVLDQAEDMGYVYVNDVTHLSGAAGTDRPLLGLFSPGNMDLEYAPLYATPAGTGAAQKCVANPDRTQAQPHLEKMARIALQNLEQKSARSDKGFFLQIEGASIDKQDHAANLCGQIGETLEFDSAIKTVLDYQKQHPDTLVVVTADHGHTSQIVAAGSQTPGSTATVLTADDAPMTVSYGTAPYESSQQHTGTEVRIAAKGPQAANVLGITNQTDLNTTMKRALGVID